MTYIDLKKSRYVKLGEKRGILEYRKKHNKIKESKYEEENAYMNTDPKVQSMNYKGQSAVQLFLLVSPQLLITLSLFTTPHCHSFCQCHCHYPSSLRQENKSRRKIISRSFFKNIL